jgi:hypothetical protein
LQENDAIQNNVKDDRVLPCVINFLKNVKMNQFFLEKRVYYIIRLYRKYRVADADPLGSALLRKLDPDPFPFPH